MRLLPLVALVAAVAPAHAQDNAMRHAIGTFAVKITAEAQAPAAAGGVSTARMGLAKTFSGGMTGTSLGTMLSAGTPSPGQAVSYVAIDQVDATIDGRHGGFVLLHRGTMDGKGGNELNVAIAPGSGTGALTGIAGTLTITIAGGVHRYDLAYTLPATK